MLSVHFPLILEDRGLDLIDVLFVSNGNFHNFVGEYLVFVPQLGNRRSRDDAIDELGNINSHLGEESLEDALLWVFIWWKLWSIVINSCTWICLFLLRWFFSLFWCYRFYSKFSLVACLRMNSFCFNNVLFLLRLRFCLFFALLCVWRKDSFKNLLLLQLQLFNLFLSILLSKFQIIYSLINRWSSPSQSLGTLFLRLISKFFLYLYLWLNQSNRYRWADSSCIIIDCCLFD